MSAKIEIATRIYVSGDLNFRKFDFYNCVVFLLSDVANGMEWNGMLARAVRVWSGTERWPNPSTIISNETAFLKCDRIFFASAH